MSRRSFLHLPHALIGAAAFAAAFGPALVSASEPQLSAVSGQMEERHAGLVSEGTAKKINQLQELATAEKYDEVIAGFKALLPKVAGNDYETALVLQNLGNAHFGKGGSTDYRAAIGYFEQTLAFKALPIPTENSMVYTIAQLHMQLEAYAKTVTLLGPWFKATTNPRPESFVLMANALGLQGKWREALPWVQKAIAATDRPQESWYALQLYAQYELKDYKACAETLEVLVSLWPDNKKYWDQLAGMYIETKEDTKALAVMGLARRKGYMAEERNIVNLAQMYFLNDAPFEGAQLLDQAIAAKQVVPTLKTYQILAEAWIAAREWSKATETLGRGCEVAPDGEMCVRKAQIHVDRLEYAAAVKAIERAFQKGTLRRPGYAYMIAGRAAAETRSFKEAEAAFMKARGFEDTRNSANTWLDYVRELQAAR